MSKPESKIVAAVGTSVSARDPHLAKRIEAAMQQAIRHATMVDGVALDDSVALLKRMMQAREAAKAKG